MERAPLLAVQKIDERLAEAGGRRRDVDAGLLHRCDLVLGAALAPGDDRAGMAHAAPRRRSAAGDEADDGFRPAALGLVLQEPGGVLLRLAADFADHHDRLRL